MWGTSVIIALAVAADPKVGDLIGHLPEVIPHPPALIEDLDLRAALIGFGGGFVVAWILSAVLSTAKAFIKYGIVAAIMVAASAGYFGEVRRRAGLSTSVLSSPTEILEDTKGAAQKMKLHLESTKGALEKIDKDK